MKNVESSWSQKSLEKVSAFLIALFSLGFLFALGFTGYAISQRFIPDYPNATCPTKINLLHPIFSIALVAFCGLATVAVLRYVRPLRFFAYASIAVGLLWVAISTLTPFASPDMVADDRLFVMSMDDGLTLDVAECQDIYYDSRYSFSVWPYVFFIAYCSVGVILIRCLAVYFQIDKPKV